MLKRMVIAAILVLAVAAPPLHAHPPDQMRGGELGAVELQVMAFRQELADAIAVKDAGKMRQLYAESFTHTHGSGKMDGRDTRIVSALAGDPVIETAPVEELSIRPFGTETAVVTGRSPILNTRENRHYDFRWIAVYVRASGTWQLAASQATRLPLP